MRSRESQESWSLPCIKCPQRLNTSKSQRHTACIICIHIPRTFSFSEKPSVSHINHCIFHGLLICVRSNPYRFFNVTRCLQRHYQHLVFETPTSPFCALPRVLVIWRESRGMCAFRDFTRLDLLQGVYSLAIGVEGKHQMHAVRGIVSLLQQFCAHILTFGDAWNTPSAA